MCHLISDENCKKSDGKVNECSNCNKGFTKSINGKCELEFLKSENKCPLQ